MIKFTAQVRADILAWIEEHGIFPQPKGRPIRELCEHFGIDEKTWWRWRNKIPGLPEDIAHAQSVFASTLESTAVDKLIERAIGAEQVTEKTTMEAQVVEEFDPTGKLIKRYKTDKGVIKSKVVIKTVTPPDVSALQYLLNNIAPERWKNKQTTEVGGTETEIPIVVRSQDTADKLRKIIAAGAQPRQPEAPDEN